MDDKKNQISLGEDGVLDLRSNSILPSADTNGCPIIGTGASAGGLEALELFFKKIPAIVVWHLLLFNI